MVVDGHCAYRHAIVEGDGLMIFDVLENVDIFASNGFEDFGFDFAIRKERVAGFDLEFWRPIAVRGPWNEHEARVGIVREIDLSRDEFLAYVIPHRQSLGFSVESALVNPGKLTDYLVRKRFCAGASENAQ
jgi:hypothetical protein